MFAFLLRRIGAAVPVLIIVSFGVFLFQALIPGDIAVQVAGEGATPEQVATVRQQLNLDEPLLARYGIWIWSVVQGDLGASIYDNTPVATEMAGRLPVSLSLVFSGVLIAVVIGLPLGALSGVFTNGWVDRVTRVISSIGFAVPSFVLAILLIVVFSVQLQWLPALGYVDFTSSPVGWVQHIVLGAVALGAVLLAVFARQLRAAMADVMSSHFVRATWARGGTRGLVIGKHGLKNSLIPAVTVLSVQIGALLGGSVIIEQIFSIPGLGPYILEAIQRGDYPVIQGVALFFAVSQMVISILLDICYGLLNPKVRVH